LATREQLVGRGPAFAESSMFALHLDRPLDRLGLRLEIAARQASHAWPPVLVLAVWLTAGALLGVLLIAIARWMSRFILAVRSGTTSRAEYAVDGSLFRRQANVLQFQRSSSRAATEKMSETRP